MMNLTYQHRLDAKSDGSIERKETEEPWLSPECGPYSIMQNANQRTLEQVEELRKKREYVSDCGRVVYDWHGYKWN